MIKPGQTYDRAGVVVLVLRKRSTPPDDADSIKFYTKTKGAWFDVYNIASDTSIAFHEPGQIVAWHESLFHESRCKRLG